jgi:endonuclease/exonuclease/phosphatase family metal-dependent hydrolase
MKYLLFITAFINWACDPLNNRISETDLKIYQRSELVNVAQKDTLLFATYNIKFGGGRLDFFFDCFGQKSIMDSTEVIENLKNVAAIIQQINPDVLFIQEIDIHSKRSAYIDQVQWLLDHTQLNYAVYVPQWKSRFIPSNDLGQMNSGIAIASKEKLSSPQYMALPQRSDQSALVRYFYLRRGILSAQTTHNSKTLQLITTHAEAYAKDGTKKHQIDTLFNYLARLQGKSITFVFGGDLNCLPPQTTKTKGFPDSACNDEFMADDYSMETEWMRPFYQHFFAETPLTVYQQNNELFFTHSVHKSCFWNRKLDYLFSNKPFVENSQTTHQHDFVGGITTMMTSDHCPVSAKLFLQ